MQLNKKTGALLLSIFVISATSISALIFLLPNSDDNIDTNHENVEVWLEDFDALCNFVQGNYPYLKLKNRTHGYNW